MALDLGATMLRSARSGFEQSVKDVERGKGVNTVIEVTVNRTLSSKRYPARLHWKDLFAGMHPGFDASSTTIAVHRPGIT